MPRCENSELCCYRKSTAHLNSFSYKLLSLERIPSIHANFFPCDTYTFRTSFAFRFDQWLQKTALGLLLGAAMTEKVTQLEDKIFQTQLARCQCINPFNPRVLKASSVYPRGTQPATPERVACPKSWASLKVPRRLTLQVIKPAFCHISARTAVQM